MTLNLLTMASHLYNSFEPDSSGLQPTSNGLQPDSNGLQPTSDGLQPTSDGLQPNGDVPAGIDQLHPLVIADGAGPEQAETLSTRPRC